jgi:putative peptidoglycan binding protein
VTLPLTPNKVSPSSIKLGDSGWPVYALQRALSAHGKAVNADGDFGPLTDAKVKELQRRLRLTVDGIAGPKTQEAICVELCDDIAIQGLPPGLPRSLVEGESGYYLGAVNWNVSGGVDCCVVQRRVIGPPFSPTILRDAYDPAAAIIWALKSLDARAEEFFDDPGVRQRSDRLEYSIRLALLAHNWPWAASELAAGHALSTTKEADWARIRDRNGNLIPDPEHPGQFKHVLFSDGARVWSYRDWAEFYALGGRHGEARMTKYVKRWPS